MIKMKKLPIYISLLLLLTCAKEDSQAPNNTPSNITPRYTLTASAGEGGSVSPTTGSFNSGTQVSVTATPNSGYQFTSWSNGSTVNPVTVTLNSNTSITANFEVLINSYTLTVVSTEGGSTTGQGEYNEGTEVTLTATASEGYRFTGWSDGSTEESITITLNSDTALTANFEVIPVYGLIINVDEGGTVEGAGEYNEGTEVTITATANECYKFTEWSDGDVNNPRTISLDSDLNLNANFESLANEIEYNLVRLKFPCALNNASEKPYNETNKYKVSSYGWLNLSNRESHNGFYYPTPDNYTPPRHFTTLPHNFDTGDFNNDGLEDMVVTWSTFPHTIERFSRYSYSILINNGDGSMTYNHDAFINSSSQNNHHPYRTIVADFNGDGYDDFVSVGSGVSVVSPDGNGLNIWQRIPLMINTGDGKFIDSSTNIEGQEDGFSPVEGMDYGHHISVGDVDGDGDIDIYAASALLINDGNGNFTNKINELPSSLRPIQNSYQGFIMSSVIADFNNDGVDDIFASYADSANRSQHPHEGYTGVYSISQNGNPSYIESDIGYLSDAKYGISNTKFNYVVAYDVNLDGYKDIVVAVTRSSPYYVGKGLQIFLNVEDLNTGNRKFIPGDYLLPDESVMDEFQGEGMLSVLDVNNDGVLDIAHSSASGQGEFGLSFYINNSGSLSLFDMNEFAFMSQEQIPGKENWGLNGWLLTKAMPINLDNSGWIDYISTIDSGLGDEGGSEHILYSVLSKD